MTVIKVGNCRGFIYEYSHYKFNISRKGLVQERAVLSPNFSDDISLKVVVSSKTYISVPISRPLSLSTLLIAVIRHKSV